ncbi:sulfite exporter TauE/SafE family protein [Ferrimonas balearica]|uniref:sulfite exporter TauE/SafE family protein n=1 Tax=Ferrimonas balearica TaxID=44012 RepID=UPI001C593A70|nr:sulfite exporter TauE/SafE family protein [Ferrimonas balearica]MBW3140921.1 sulfite exporter TauE/SafE family protein [Ferrimonas balearica]
MDLSLLWVLAVVTVGAAVQGAIGFGLAVVVTPILYMIDPAWVPAPIILMGMALSILTMWRIRAPLDIGVLAPALLGRIPGGIIGTYLLVVASAEWLGLGIGLIVLVAVALTVRKYSVAFTKANLFWAGTLSGVFSSISAIGGPPMALLLNHHRSAAQMRQTLSSFFLFGCIIALTLLALAGELGWDDLLRGFWLLPATALGFAIGDKLANRVEPERLKTATLLICALAGTLLVLRSAIALWPEV